MTGEEGGTRDGGGARRAGDWVRLKSVPRGPRAYRKLVAATSGRLRGGARVAVLDPEGEVLGWGIWHPRSRIAVRLLRRGPEPADDAWLRERAGAAVAARLEDPSIAGSGCAYRVIHAEGDDFPGLVVDRLGDVLSAEVFTVGAGGLFDGIRPVLEEKLGTRHWRIAFDRASAEAEGEMPLVRHSEGCPRRAQLEEGGVRFEVRFEEGHKTGFFCDQRENRRRLAALARGRSVLDLCCYTGGFAVAAACGGAREVTGVDLDERALDLARRNANLNGARVRFAQADAFAYLREMQRHGRAFEIVVLDPPKFVPSRREWDDGIARYHDLNKLALRAVAPGGMLVTCSCSGLVPLEVFQDTVRRAARGLGRAVRRLRVTGAGPDHPVRIDFPEGGYLKVLWLRIS